MNILVTGSSGFVGKNLVEALKNIRDNKDRTRPDLIINEIYLFDRENTEEELRAYLSKADFIFNLAGVNRPKDNSEFKEGNRDFIKILIDNLKEIGNACPLMISSSLQASLEGRYEGSEYGISKLEGEKLAFNYSKETGNKVLVYRFPNLFGKWCKPNYNSVVATFCNNIANDLEIRVNNRNTLLEMLYIDDLVTEMLDALEGKENRCNYKGVDVVPNTEGEYCFVPTTHEVSLGEIADLLYLFKDQSKTLVMPEIPENSFAKKLYSTYLSYLPKNKMAIDLKMNKDERGSFTELLKTKNNGQFSVNISKPGITKGQHWHNSKWEFFIVVSGRALIQERKIGVNPETGEKYPVIEFEVTGEEIKAIHMLPGYTHNIINLSEEEDLVTVMWANEMFDPGHPDTFFEEV